jgi:hypothetical protein
MNNNRFHTYTVSYSLLWNAKWTYFQLYHGEDKLLFDEMITMVCTALEHIILTLSLQVFVIAP